MEPYRIPDDYEGMSNRELLLAIARWAKGVPEERKPSPNEERPAYAGWRPIGDGSYFAPPPGYHRDGVMISGIVRRSEVPREVVEKFFPKDEGEVEVSGEDAA